MTFLSEAEEETTDGVISWPGEYNAAGVSIRGIGHKDGQQVSFVMQADGTRLAFLSSPLQDWTEHQIETVGDIDVLFLPAEDVKLVQKLVDEFDPRVIVVLPGKDKDETDSVFKAIGAKGVAAVDEYKLKGLPAEGRDVVVLSK
jgi:hypothetical protein